MAFVVSSLADYVANNKEIISKDIALGAQSIESATIMPDVKGSADLNLLAVAPVLASGASCGFSASGNATFTARTLVTAPIKVNMSFCKKTLLGKWTEYVVRFGANNNEFPFEAYILGEIQKGIKKQMEKAVWQSDTANSGLFDGWLKIINAASGTIKETIASGKSAYDAIWQVYMAIPEEVLETEGLCIRVSPLVFRAFVKELTDMNMYHYTADDTHRVILPGTNVPVVMTEGLADGVGTNYRKIVATYDANRYFGCDILSAMEDLAAWYSQDNDEFRVKADFNAGVQIAFPDLCVLGTMQADPVSPARSIVSLQNIATNTTPTAEG